jgi:hypothetical protein
VPLIAYGLSRLTAPPSEMGAAFLLQYLSAELRCKCFSGGELRKAPSNEIVLIVAATRASLVFDPALVVKLVDVALDHSEREMHHTRNTKWGFEDDCMQCKNGMSALPPKADIRLCRLSER